MSDSDLALLLDNQIACIEIDNFLSATQISNFLAALGKEPEWKEADIVDMHARFFDHQLPRSLFSSQYMIISHGKDEDHYLNLCQDYLNIWKKITDESQFDPFELLIEYIKKTNQREIKPAAKGKMTYCPVLVRDLSTKVLPHADFGPFDGPNWTIDQVRKQLAWNIYLTDPNPGGETTVYDCFWNNIDEIDSSSYGIENFNQPIKTTFKVKPGKLVLFNSRNFHSITPASSERIAIGGLLGETVNKDMIAWC